jgi:hypothetical protein
MFNQTASIDELVGKSYFFRTVTYHFVGKVTGIFNTKFLILKNASWVADSGRFGNAIATGELDEVEFVEDACINLDSVTDFMPWKHKLPSVTK